MNLQNKKNYLSKLIGIIAIVMTLSVIFPSMSHFFTGQSSTNVAHAIGPGEGKTGNAKTEEEAKKQVEEDEKKEKEKKDSEDGKSSEDGEDKKEDSEDSEDSDKDKDCLLYTSPSPRDS